MTAERILWKAPESTTQVVRNAKDLASLCDREFFLLFGKKNAMDSVKRGGRFTQIPFVCVGRDTADYWVLQCNDDTIPDDQLDQLRDKIKAWEKTRMFNA